MKYQVSFRAKTCYLHKWKDQRCYGYIIYNIEGKITECWLVETEGIFY